MKKKIAVILTVFLLVAVFSFASFKIAKTLTDYREAKKYMTAYSNSLWKQNRKRTKILP